MPTNSSAGAAGENTFSARLAALLRRRGFPDADFERLFEVVDSITAKKVQRKPDVVFSNGGVNIVSAKEGERREREAIATAIGYLRDMSASVRLGEVFAVTYPIKNKDEKYHLHVLPTQGHQEVSLVLENMDEVCSAMLEAVQGRVAEIERRQEPVQDEARRILRYAAFDLSESLRGISESSLEEIFGGHHFFQAALATLLKPDERIEALHLGPAYLFIDQILFYVLLSQAATSSGKPHLYPRIAIGDRNSPVSLSEKYFDRVRSKDYDPIYGPDVARLFEGAKVGQPVEEIVDTIMELGPKLAVPDLVGQIFQSLIPLSIRKPLGAHYTNPNAAALLARLSIDDKDAVILDPACGSGTLLVAGYKRKMELSGPSGRGDKHRQFVEHDITGIDAMAFSCHLAAVNLALQQPLLETDYVRIGRADSTLLHPKDIIKPPSESMQYESKQTRILDDFSKKGSSAARIPSMKEGHAEPITLSKVDLVIMNPPIYFTE